MVVLIMQILPRIAIFYDGSSMLLHIPLRNNSLSLVKNNHYYTRDSGFYDLNCTCSKNV